MRVKITIVFNDGNKKQIKPYSYRLFDGYIQIFCKKSKEIILPLCNIKQITIEPIEVI